MLRVQLRFGRAVGSDRSSLTEIRFAIVLLFSRLRRFEIFPRVRADSAIGRIQCDGETSARKLLFMSKIDNPRSCYFFRFSLTPSLFRFSFASLDRRRASSYSLVSWNGWLAWIAWLMSDFLGLARYTSARGRCKQSSRHCPD